MQGFNVFFPLGFHATGLDCVNIHDRLKENLENAKRYGIPIDEAATLQSPFDMEKCLERLIVDSLERLGLSLDFRPKFSTLAPVYGRFVQWQFEKLHELGQLVQRDHYLPWCSKCGHPVSLDAAEADISEWKGAAIKEYTIIKFRDQEGRVFPTSTLRPETVFGVTNLWVNPEADYVEAQVNGEKWITSKRSCRKLADQGKNISITKELSGTILEGLEVTSPVANSVVQVLLADFANADEATGVVMSVPAHDPYDYMYVKAKYGRIKPVQVIKLKDMGKLPAAHIVREFDIRDLTDPRLEEAVKELYKRETTGRIVSSINRFGGMETIEAREAVKRYLAEIRASDTIYELSVKPIYCRCGAEIKIRVIKDQWFINYADPNWKLKAKRCIAGLRTYPPAYKRQLPEIVDWLALRPCVRKRGLGTPFPLDQEWTIEALSDSTLYMALFPVTKCLNQALIREDQLTSRFFDYVFLGLGSTSEVSASTGIRQDLLAEMRQEFDYWYPLDLNAGGKEHRTVHFPFFIFHHVAIFPENRWPKGIFVNWHLIAYGQKMSKHLGNTVFLDDALRKHGADTIRLYLMHGANQWRDFDWRDEDCGVYQRHLERFRDTLVGITNVRAKKDAQMDAWLRSVVNQRVRDVTSALEDGEIRKAVDAAFFGLWSDIEWYLKRTSSKAIDAEHVRTWIKVLAPFIPHICEDLWRMLGETSFISLERWPGCEEKDFDANLVELEGVLKKTIEDTKHVAELTGRRELLYLYTASEDEFRHFHSAKEFLRRDLDFTQVHVFMSNDPDRYDPENKAQKARPGRPGIHLV